MAKQPVRRDCAGLTLIETLLGLAIAAIITLVVVMLFAIGVDKSNASVEADNARSLVEGIVKTFGVTGSYANLSAPNLIAKNIVPETMLQQGSASQSITTSWGGNVWPGPYYIYNTQSGTSLPAAMSLEYSGVDTTACQAMAQALAPSAYLLYLYNTSTGWSQVMTINASTAQRVLQVTGPPVAPATGSLTVACGGNSMSAGKGYLYFVYYDGLPGKQNVATPL